MLKFNLVCIFKHVWQNKLAEIHLMIRSDLQQTKKKYKNKKPKNPRA